jgi:phage tail protein X
MGLITAHQGQMQGMWRRDVVNKTGQTGKQSRVLGAPHGLSDHGRALGHWRPVTWPDP